MQQHNITVTREDTGTHTCTVLARSADEALEYAKKRWPSHTVTLTNNRKEHTDEQDSSM